MRTVDTRFKIAIIDEDGRYERLGFEKSFINYLDRTGSRADFYTDSASIADEEYDMYFKCDGNILIYSVFGADDLNENDDSRARRIYARNILSVIQNMMLAMWGNSITLEMDYSYLNPVYDYSLYSSNVEDLESNINRIVLTEVDDDKESVVLFINGPVDISKIAEITKMCEGLNGNIEVYARTTLNTDAANDDLNLCEISLLKS